ARGGTEPEASDGNQEDELTNARHQEPEPWSSHQRRLLTLAGRGHAAEHNLHDAPALHKPPTSYISPESPSQPAQRHDRGTPTAPLPEPCGFTPTNRPAPRRAARLLAPSRMCRAVP